MKKYAALCIMVLLVLCTAAFGDVPIDEEHFPDEMFRLYVSIMADEDSDNVLSDAEASERSTIALSDLGISSLKGIEYFTELSALDCSSNSLDILDLSSNPNLQLLYCNDNLLESLDITNCANLAYLHCSGNRLTELGVSGKLSLMEVICYDNSITELDFTGNEYLISLDCSSNQLSDLKISDSFLLSMLDCHNNKLSQLDISGKTRLSGLDCSNNNLEVLDVTSNYGLLIAYCNNNLIEYLNFSSCQSLINLNCSGNKLSSLNISNNPSLSMLDCHDNELNQLDISGKTYLTGLDCQNNSIDVLVTGGNVNLQDLLCRNNMLASLDISECQSLVRLDCAKNTIADLDLTSASGIAEVFCFDNMLTSLNVGGCSSLQLLLCFNNRLTSLDVSTCTSLADLECNDNFISYLNINGCTELDTLYCWGNRLKALDVSSNSALTILACTDNDIRELDLTHNEYLVMLDCQRMGLTELDLTHNTQLVTLYCRNNFIAELDVSKNTALEHLDCPFNFLTALDVSGNTALISLDCSSNDIASLDVSANTSLRYLKCDQDFETLYAMPSGNSDYPFKMDMNEYITGDLSRLESITAYTSEGAVVASNFDRSGRILFLAGQPHHVVYVYDVRYAGSASDVPEVMNVIIGMPTQHFVVPGGVNWLTNAVLNNEIMNTAVKAFPGMTASDVHTFKGIITNEVWTPDNADISALAGTGKGVVFTLPETQPEIDGIYVIVCMPGDDVKASDKLSVYDFNGTGSVHESEYVFIDEGGRVVDSAGDNKLLYLALKFTAGSVNRNVIASSGISYSSGSTGSSGGGCNSGLGFAALISVVLVCVTVKRRTGLTALILIMASCAAGWASEGVKTSDYVLPIPFEMYTPAGTCTVDFEFTPEIAEKVAERLRDKLSLEIESSDVHSFADIALPGTWNLKPGDIRNIAASGQYGAALLPITPSGTNGDVYVTLCTFSDDVEPGEIIQLYGLTIDTELRENTGTIELDTEEYTPEGYTGGYYVVLDENLNVITSVPKSRKVYFAASLYPDYVNTGVITVIRGKYMTEDDPLTRINPSLAQFIAEAFGISVDELKYLNYASLGEPREPTEAMKQYIASEDREIMLNMPTVSVDEGYKAVYFVYTLPDDVWEEVKGKPVSDYTIYALNDDEELTDAFSGQMKGSFINGVISLWELSGGKMDSFGVKEFVIAGLLQSGTPFSLYLTKILLALLMGGCSSGVNFVLLSAVIIVLAAVKFSRRF